MPDLTPEFESFLVGEGAKCIRRERGPMMSHLIEYISDDIRVRFVCERGYWGVDVADPTFVGEELYDVRLFTYLLHGKLDSKMPFDRQLEYLRANWQEIVAEFSKERRLRTYAGLSAAKMELARVRFAIWPDAVQDLELFLKEQGLKLIVRKEPRFLYDWMKVEYSDSKIGLKMTSRDGWHLDFADVVHDPRKWYSFRAIRMLIQWPQDTEMNYLQKFAFVKANWQQIVALFGAEKSAETYERIAMLEQALSKRGHSIFADEDARHSATRQREDLENE